MNVQQYVRLQTSQYPKTYLSYEPEISLDQINAMHVAIKKYLNSTCVNQNAPQVSNVLNIFNSSNQNVINFKNKLIKAVIFNYMTEIIPVNNEYIYDAGTCSGSCGNGRNPIVALLVNTLIDMNIPIQDIMLGSELTLLSVWATFKSNIVSQSAGSNIIYNMNPTC